MTDDPGTTDQSAAEQGARQPTEWAALTDELRKFFSRRVAAAEVDDLVQEVFVRISAGVDSLREQDRFAPWVFRIAHNLVVDHLRGRLTEIAGEAVEEASAPVAQPDAQHEVAAWMQSYVDQLPETYSEVMQLSELSELTHREIAERLGLSISGVKTRVQRGRAMLRKNLLACCSFEFDRRGRIVDHTRNSPGSCDC